MQLKSQLIIILQLTSLFSSTPIKYKKCSQKEIFKKKKTH